MTSILQEQIGVDTAGTHWDVPGFRLWQSTVPEILLYVPKELSIALGSEGRHRALLIQKLRWRDHSYELTGGSAMLGFIDNSFPNPLTARTLESEWSRRVRNTGYAHSTAPRFIPLPVRDVRLTATLDPAQASVAAEENEVETNTLLIDLTAVGARDWTRSVREGAGVPGGIRLSYTYPQLMAPATATVQAHGQRVYAGLSARLDRRADGTLYGTHGEIQAAWAGLVRDGAVEVVLHGATSSTSTSMRDDLIDQTREHLFDTFFVPYVNPSTASGIFYALRWRHAGDVPDIPIRISVEGWNWLSASLDAKLSVLLSSLDPSYIETFYESVSLPVLLAVEPSSYLTAATVSLNFGDVHAPEAPTFDRNGGSRHYLVTIQRPETTTISYRASVSYEPATWPVLTVEGQVPMSGEGYRLVLQPARWLRRHTIYMYVRRGDQILTGEEASSSDYLAVTSMYEGPGLPAPIRTAARITPKAPIELIYPVPPGTAAGRATLSAVGMVGGELVQGSALDVQEGEEALYLLVDGSRVQTVGRNSLVSESDNLADRLRTANARPVVALDTRPVAENERRLNVEVEVFLTPQPTDVSCWAAALAMVVSARDSISIGPDAIANAAGMDVGTGYAWTDIRQAVRTWDLVEEGPRSAAPSEWANLLEGWGPIWIVEVGAPYHAVVLGAVYGDGTPDGTLVKLYNPWPPGEGAVEWRTFHDFDWDFGLGAGAGAAMVHANQ